MDNLILNQTLASLPVTDIIHVVKEINQHRLVLEMMEQARKYDRKRNQKYRERRKEKW